eukprot:8562043-Pyramimonas_sp.AAC.1
MVAKQLQHMVAKHGRQAAEESIWSPTVFNQPTRRRKAKPKPRLVKPGIWTMKLRWASRPMACGSSRAAPDHASPTSCGSVSSAFDQMSPRTCSSSSRASDRMSPTTCGSSSPASDRMSPMACGSSSRSSAWMSPTTCGSDLVIVIDD